MDYKRCIMLALFLCLLAQYVLSTCVNNTEFRYQLTNLVQIQGYNSMCSQFTTRTCCSPKNIDVLTRKISKALLNGVQELSFGCKNKLSHMMCSYCDGDISEGLKQGICQSYCLQVYQACKNDIFVVDTNNKLRVCKQQDLVCAKLMFIVPKPQQQKVCQLYGFTQKRMGCWGGQNSSKIKGKAKKKIKYSYKRVIPGRQEEKSSGDETKMYLIAVMCIVFGGLLFMKWGRGLFKSQRYYRLDQ